MPRTVVRVDGARQLRATMKAAGEDLSDLKDVNARTAAKVAAVAVPRVPRRTGTLAATVRPAGTKTAAIVRAGKASVPYGPIIEFGWPDHNIAAQPYIVSTAHDTEPEWTTFYEQEIAKILDRIKGV
jgi:hypothetical protein